MQHNLKTIQSVDIEKYFHEIISRLEFITSLYMVLLILIDSTLIASSDYVSYLDVGLEPPDNSQYWVAPFIKEFLDEYIYKIDDDIKEFIKCNDRFNMDIG